MTTVARAPPIGRLTNNIPLTSVVFGLFFPSFASVRVLLCVRLVEKITLNVGRKVQLLDGGQPPLAHSPPNAQPAEVHEAHHSWRPGDAGRDRETCCGLLARAFKLTVAVFPFVLVLCKTYILLHKGNAIFFILKKK